MAVNVTYESNTRELEISVKLKLPETLVMLDIEQELQNELNEGGNQATGKILEKFDSDGSAIEIGCSKFTSKGEQAKEYQTPYGVATVQRHVYQMSKGGKTFCPLDNRARIINSSTPHFAKTVSSKYARMNAADTQQDLLDSNGRKVSRHYIQNIARDVGKILEEKETTWTYADAPIIDDEVNMISIGIDGTCMYLCDDGYREAMVGTIALYNDQAQRLHTTYIGQDPEYGKATFFDRMEREIGRYRVEYPEVTKWIAIADGARENWLWLERFVNVEVLDFYHASGYLEHAAKGLAIARKDRKTWIKAKASALKNEEDTALNLLEEIEETLEDENISQSRRKSLETIQSYYSNNFNRMNYAHYQDEELPIGSGITESAAKTIIKQRMCASGMKWKTTGARNVINLRTMVKTNGRWEDFWNKISNHGINNF